MRNNKLTITIIIGVILAITAILFAVPATKTLTSNQRN